MTKKQPTGALNYYGRQIIPAQQKNAQELMDELDR
jgi:hypothetical protein